MYKKHLVRLWITLVFLAVASGAYLLLPNTATAPKTTSSTPVVAQNLPWENVATDTAISEPTAKTTPKTAQDKPETPVASSSSTATETPPTPPQNTLAVTMQINGQKYHLNLSEKSTAYDAMTQLVADKKITAVFKEFSGLGYFVDEIDGVKTDKSAGKYWIYYLNDKPAQAGISQYILKNNDSLIWKYEVPQF